jgi:ubiquinone/menaquinone biosynthesis C-methylase UbiE
MAPAPHHVSGSSASQLSSAAEGYERWARTYDHSPNPLLAREERYLLPLLGDVRKKRILDLACGTGRWLEKLAAQGSQLCVGLDCSAAMLGRAAQKRNIAGRLTRGYCEALPIVTNLVDLAICSFALGHVANLATFAAEVSRVVRPGADLFITDLHPEAYDHGWRVGFRDEVAAVEIDTYARSANEVLEVFSCHGFCTVGTESLRLEAPEQTIFARAGKAHRFESAARIPAIIAYHFRRSQPANDLWET